MQTTTLRMTSWLSPASERLDTGIYRFTGDVLEAHGTSTTGTYALSFRLVTGAHWVTRSLEVHVRTRDWWRTLVLCRQASGSWAAAWDGTAGVARPRDLEGDLSQALDCDLGLCPVTNTMPILRHGLIAAAHAGAARAENMVMAWVSVPDLHVRPSAQTYLSSEIVEGGGALVIYQSEKCRTAIEVDADGIVVNYPDLAHQILTRSLE